MFVLLRLYCAVSVTHFKSSSRYWAQSHSSSRRGKSQAIYLKDDENIDPSQDDSSDGHLCLHGDVERLVGHGQWHHLIVLQEGLSGDDDRVTVQETKQNRGHNDMTFVFPLWYFKSSFFLKLICRRYLTLKRHFVVLKRTLMLNVLAFYHKEIWNIAGSNNLRPSRITAIKTHDWLDSFSKHSGFANNSSLTWV